MENFFENLKGEALSYYDSLIALLPKLVLALIVLAIFWFIATRTRRFARARLSRYADDPLLTNFLARLIGLVFILFGLAAFLNIVGLGKTASGIVAGAGLSAFIIGFAFKDIGENFLAGILMAFKRPFRIGDVVEISGIRGTIIGLSLRDTQIKTMDGKDVYIPNGNILKNPIINFTIDGFLRQEFTVGLDYGSDAPRAIEIIKQTLLKVPGILKEDKKPSVHIGELAASSLSLKVYFWIDTFDKNTAFFQVKNEAIDEVLKAMEEAGFYLPGDIVELKNYKDTGLQTG